MGEVEAKVGRGTRSDIVLVVVIDEEKEKALKTGYITRYNKFFMVTGPVS
mgnify:CR=1 FL=1